MREYKAIEAKELITMFPQFEGAIEYIEEYSQSDYTDSSHFFVSSIEDAIENAEMNDEEDQATGLKELEAFLDRRNITLIFWDN